MPNAGRPPSKRNRSQDQQARCGGSQKHGHDGGPPRHKPAIGHIAAEHGPQAHAYRQRERQPQGFMDAHAGVAITGGDPGKQSVA